MRFLLEGRIEFSGDLAPAQGDIERFLKEEAPAMLAKGAPAGEGCTVKGWRVEGPALLLSLESGHHVRPHEGLFRLRKVLAERLGKAHRLGVRAVSGERYTIEIDLDRPPKAPFRVPLVEDLRFDGNRAVLVMGKMDEAALRERLIDRLVNLVRDRVAAQHYEGKEAFWELLWQSPRKEPLWNSDPTVEMERRDWLRQGPGQGQWFYHPRAAALLRMMERIAVEHLLKPLGASEVIAPKLTPFEIWERTGHLSGAVSELYYVSVPKTRDPKYWEEATDIYKLTKAAPVEEYAKRTEGPVGGLCYAQCPPFYWALSGKTLAGDSLPLLLYDRSGPSFRWESGGRHGIERVNEFHRIEVVFIGTPEQMADIKEKLIELYRRIFNEVLDLEWRMAWVTPFYMQQAGSAGVEDAAAKVKGTIDFEAYLPCRGSREESEWLEFQNLSVLGDKYTSAFNIKVQKGELWSGCSGIGLQRWTAAFTAQKGLDPERWPEAARRFYEEPKGGMRFL